MIINHNIASLNTQRQLSVNTSNQSKNIEKLSSGLRINRAGDDAAGLAISEKMRGQIRGLDQASRNAQDAISMVQSAEGALNETHSILQRMRELATQASNDTNTISDRGEIQKEINQLTSEINRIGNTTEFNTQKLINGEKANTMKVTGMNFVGGSDTTKTNVGGTGLDVKLLSGTDALSAGAHTLDITVDRNTRADQVVNAKFSDLGGTGAADGVKFTDSKIAADNTVVAATWTLTYNDTDKVFNLSNGLTGAGKVEDVVKVGEAYSNHGLTFNISDKGTIANGETLTFTTTASTAKDFGTEQVGFTAAATAGAASNPAAVTLTLKDTEQLANAGGGKVTVTWNAANDIDVEILDAAGKSLSKDKVTGGTSYDNHGLNINFAAAATAGNAGAKIEFDITDDTYTVKGKLDGGTAQTISSTYNGTATNAVTDFTGIKGLELDSSAALKAGSYTINAEQTITGTDKSINFQIGANQNQALNLSISDMRSEALGISSKGSTSLTFKNNTGGTETINLAASKDITDGTNATGAEYGLDVSTSANASKAITVINNAVELVSAERSKLGAYQNRLDHTINNLNTSSENLTAAESRIRDVDMAKEMSDQTKNSILAQAAQAMLAQANQQPQGVLQLLR